MADHISNDNDFAQSGDTQTEPDAHGLAALLLAESIVHGLLARSIITVADAVEIVETAVEICAEMVEQSVSAATTLHALTMLDGISTSLKNDLPDD